MNPPPDVQVAPFDATHVFCLDRFQTDTPRSIAATIPVSSSPMEYPVVAGDEGR